MGLPLSYVARRLVLYVLVIWVAATINFFMPRIAPGDPMGAVLARLQAQGGKVENPGALIAEYRRTFGLDESLWSQYVRYLGNLTRLEFGYSIAHFPANVATIIARRLPWTIGLLATTWTFSFLVGTALGALMAWPRSPGFLRALTPLTMVFAAIPYYLMALLLLWLLAFTFPIFPAFGAERVGKVVQEVTWARVIEILYYSALPALTIIFTSVGGWAIGMRGMMITVLGEDFLTLATAKGLTPRRIFFSYGVRNAILPQITGLAIALGNVVSGAIIVELLFSYPGVGYLLYEAITGNDYPVIQGITFLLVVSVATVTLLVDLLYPRIDPRIRYER